MLVLSEPQISRTALVHVDDDSLMAAHIGIEGAPYLALPVHCSHSQNKASPKSKHQLGDHQGDSLPLYLFKLSRLGSATLGPSLTLCFLPSLHPQAAGSGSVFLQLTLIVMLPSGRQSWQGS